METLKPIQGDTPMNRRRFLKTGAAAALSGLAFPSKAFLSSKPLKLGYLPITDATPLLVAHGLGYFAQEGLDVDRPVMVRSWQILTESFLAGKFNLTHMLFPIPVWMRFKLNIPVKVLAWDHTNGSALTVGGASGIKNFSDLGGRQIAVPSWYSMHNLILQMGLRQQGLTPVIRPISARVKPDQVNLFVLSPPEMPAALLGGKIDGFIVADPFNALAQLKFKAAIMRYTGDIWKNHPCCVIVTHQGLSTEQPELAQKAVNAIVRAQNWCRKNPMEAAHLLSRNGERYFPFPENVLRKVFSDPEPGELIHPDWKPPRIGFQPYPFPSATRFIIDQMKATKVVGDTDFLTALDTTKAAGELVDDRFVKQAIKKMGGMKNFCPCDLENPYQREEIVEIS